MAYSLKNMDSPALPLINFVHFIHAGTMYQKKTFRKGRKNGHMIIDYRPLKKDYADTIVQKEVEKNGFPAFPMFPPLNFVHHGTTYQYKKFKKDEKNGYLIFDYCSLKEDLANTKVQQPVVEKDAESIKTHLEKKNDELQKKIIELTEELNDSKHKETVITEQSAKLLDDAESIKTQLEKKNDELQKKIIELTKELTESKHKETVIMEQSTKLLDDAENIKTQLEKKNDELHNNVFELTEELTESKEKEAIIMEQSTKLLDEELKKSNNGLVEQSNSGVNDILATGIQPKRRTVWCRIKKSLRRMICCA